jgi:adenylate cyclase
VLLVAIMMAAAATIPNPQESLLADAERFAFDMQMRILRDIHPRPLANDIVVIGIDEDTENAYPEPMALWHKQFASVMHALARAKPKAVGVDVVLPERSYDYITPGLDLAMMRGLFDIKRATLLVYVQTVNAHGELVPVQENYRGIIAPANLGIDQQLRDPDLVSRRFSERTLSLTDRPAPTLAGQLLRGLGLPVGEGLINYSVGAPVEYVPMHRVIQWENDTPRLEKLFRDRIVILGNLTSKTDRWRLPVRLEAREPDPGEGNRAYSQPGVLVHMQVLRTQLAAGWLHPVPEPVRWLLCALAALTVLVSVRTLMVVIGALLVPVALLALGLVSIVTAQLLIPIASLITAFWFALVVRGIFDAVEAVVERVRLQQSFAGQVSPAVMKEMLAGGLTPGLGGQLADICVLFSDVRDFTTLSENLPPEVVTTVLQRYFDRMVHAVHRFDGTVDKFIGDGMMVLFGAPRKSDDASGDAVQCALAMMNELDELNEEFKREGLPTLTIGIGINYGTVTVGNIGSSQRHNYSAIGDAVNVAARVEGLTKDLGRKIIITEAVVSRIGERFHFDPLGSHKVKGHSPVNVWGIRTARAAPAAVEPEAVQ